MLGRIDLFTLSAILFAAGLVALFFIVILIKPYPTRISEIDESFIGKTVTINASVENKILRKGSLFLDLKDNESYIKAVIFENDKITVPEINKDAYINVIGRIDKYMGNLEIIVDEIYSIS